MHTFAVPALERINERGNNPPSSGGGGKYI